MRLALRAASHVYALPETFDMCLVGPWSVSNPSFTRRHLQDPVKHGCLTGSCRRVRGMTGMRVLPATSIPCHLPVYHRDCWGICGERERVWMTSHIHPLSIPCQARGLAGN